MTIPSIHWQLTKCIYQGRFGLMLWSSSVYLCVKNSTSITSNLEVFLISNGSILRKLNAELRLENMNLQNKKKYIQTINNCQKVSFLFIFVLKLSNNGRFSMIIVERRFLHTSMLRNISLLLLIFFFRFYGSICCF